MDCLLQLVRARHDDGDPGELHHTGDVPALPGHLGLRSEVRDAQGVA